MAPSLGKIPTTSARRFTSFSIPASFVNGYIAPPAPVALAGFAAGQIGPLMMVPSGGSLLYELVRGRRLRMGYGQELKGASLFAAS